MTPVSFIFPGRIKRLVSYAVAVFAGMAVDVQTEIDRGSTLRAIEARGHLICGVDSGLSGFAEQDETGEWRGFEVDLCRAYAAAFLGRPNAVRFAPLTTDERFPALASGAVDILIRNTSWTFSRDVDMPFEFAGVAYYDGQGFMAPADLGISSARDLDGARVCVQRATTSALNLADYAATHGLDIEIREHATALAGLAAYAAGRCDVYTNDLSSLASLRVSLPSPSAHVLLPDVISKEPLGPVVRDGDAAFVNAARWVLFALIAAEEFGVTAGNAERIAATTRNSEIRRMLGAEPGFAGQSGLGDAFALNAIRASGNYGEIFDRNLGPASALQLRRGLNAQWTEGGLLYAPPFR